MHISTLKESRFIQKGELGPGWELTIRGVQMESVGQGAEAEEKAVMYFDETDKVMTLNATNAQLIAQITESEETDTWPGHRICVYHDPSINFGGRLMGGIRVRPVGMAQPQNTGVQRPPQQQRPPLQQAANFQQPPAGYQQQQPRQNPQQQWQQPGQPPQPPMRRTQPPSSRVPVDDEENPFNP